MDRQRYNRLLDLVKLIRTHENWREILSSDPYNLKIKQHPTVPTRFMFSYDMIKSDFSLPEVKVSRGLILNIEEKHIFDKSKNYAVENIETVRSTTVYARGFDKFHNYGESHADQMDWNGSLFAYEKMDGSFIKCVYDKELDKFVWMTNNGFDANAELPGDLLTGYNTFQDLIDEAIGNIHFNSDIKKFCTEYCLLFELISPYNRIVVKYDKTELILLGARSLLTGEEIGPEELVRQYDFLRSFRIPAIYNLTSETDKTLNHLIDTVSYFDSNKEGLVVQDKYFNRLKIKGAQYLSIHRLKDNNGQLSFEHLLKSIQAGTIDDVIGMFPEYIGKINEVLIQYKNVISKLEEAIHKAQVDVNYAKVLWGEDPKEQKKQYALKYKDNVFAKIYFDVWKNPTNEEEIKNNFLNKLDYEMLKRYAM